MLEYEIRGLRNHGMSMTSDRELSIRARRRQNGERQNEDRRSQ